MSMQWVGLLSLVIFLSACTTLPTGPRVSALPGQGKSFEQFQNDDVVCRQYAHQQTGITAGEAASQSAIGSAVLGTAIGAAAGAALGAASGHAAGGAAVGAGGGLLAGTAIGAGAASTSSAAVQHRYDTAYMQCMYAKGHQVPAGGSAFRPSYHPYSAVGQRWYYCENPKGYYPYVPQCPRGWMRVVPQPAAGSYPPSPSVPPPAGSIPPPPPPPAG